MERVLAKRLNEMAEMGRQILLVMVRSDVSWAFRVEICPGGSGLHANYSS